MEIVDSGITISPNNLYLWIIFGAIAGAIAHIMSSQKDKGKISVSMFLGSLGAVSGGSFATFIYGIGMQGIDLTSLAIALSASLAFLTIYQFFANSSNASR